MLFVEPIKDMDLLRDIMETLQNDKTRTGKRAYMMFSIGVYTGLRIGDILRLRVCDVTDTEITLIEEKTNKKRKAQIPKQLRRIIDEYTEEMNDTDYLFPSRNRTGKIYTPIGVRQAENIMKYIAEKYGLENFNCHSMRKTFGYMMVTKQEMRVEVLQQVFNHSSIEITRRYIGITQDEIDEKTSSFHIPFKQNKTGKAGRRKRGTIVNG